MDRFQILLADDEFCIRLALGDALEKAGYEVTRVRDGAQALNAWAERKFESSTLLTPLRKAL